MKNNEAYYLFGIKLLKITRIRVSLIILLLLFSSSSIAFSNWSNNNWESQFDIIVDGDDFFSVLNVNTSENDKRLIPLDSFLGEKEVYYYTYAYDIAISEKGMLRIYSENFSLQGYEINNLENIFKVEFSVNSQNDFTDNLIELNLIEDSNYYHNEDDHYYVKLYVRLSFDEDYAMSDETIEALQKGIIEFDVIFEFNYDDMMNRSLLDGKY